MGDDRVTWNWSARRRLLGRPSGMAHTVGTALLGLAVWAGAGAAQETSPEAGYDGGFFVQSEDGDHLLRIRGLHQVRYLRNHRNEGTSVGSSENLRLGGIQLRRTQLDLSGHLMGPQWSYRLRLDAGHGGGVSAAWAWVGYRFPGGLGLRVGQFKPGFLLEENVSAANQLAAERSYLADYFTTDFSQGVQFSKQVSDRLALVGTIHSGSYGYRTNFHDEGTEVGLAARAEYLLLGDQPDTDRGRFGDFSAWPASGPAILIGGAMNYEASEAGGPTRLPDLFKWTIDVTGKVGELALFASAVGQQFRLHTPAAAGVPSALDDLRQRGLLVQAAYFLVPERWEPFARIESIDFDGAYFRKDSGAVQSGSRNLEQDDDLRILTFGVNRYLHRHNAKITVDVVHAFDRVPVANTGGGLLRSADGGQTVLRSELQVRF